MAHRRSQMGRIDRRIRRLEMRATDLLAGERQAAEEVRGLQEELNELDGSIRAMRMRRHLRRRQIQVERLRSRRRGLVDGQVRVIMLALQGESRRARDELDRELARLVPVQEHWERLRATFDSLEEAMADPAFAPAADHWRGQLEIPEFPVSQPDGYTKPFPQQALVF